MNLDMLARFRECWEKIESIGTDYASAKADSWHKQELCGSVKASIMNALLQMPTSQKEYIAKSHPDYLQHLKETKTAIDKELRLKASWEAWKSKFEAYRSLSSLEKAEINREGH